MNNLNKFGFPTWANSLQWEPYSLQQVLSVSNSWNTSSKVCINVHHLYLLVAARGILIAVSLLNIIVPLTRTYSLGWGSISLQRVLTVLGVSTMKPPLFLNETNILQVMLCCRHKTTLTSLSKISFFRSWNTPCLWYNWRFSILSTIRFNHQYSCKCHDQHSNIT